MPPPPRSPGAAAALLLSSLLLASAATAARAEGGAAAAGNRTADDGSAAGRASSFVRWFEDSGGIFHPVPTEGGGLSAAVTVEAFPEYGGYGLALRVSEDAPRCDGAEDGATDDADSEEERTPADRDSERGQSPAETDPEGGRSAVETDESPGENKAASPAPIVSHMQSLFTVPPSLIISVSSIVDAHSSEGGEHFLPGFRASTRSLGDRSRGTSACATPAAVSSLGRRESEGLCPCRPRPEGGTVVDAAREDYGPRRGGSERATVIPLPPSPPPDRWRGFYLFRQMPALRRS